MDVERQTGLQSTVHRGIISKGCVILEFVRSTARQNKMLTMNRLIKRDERSYAEKLTRSTIRSRFWQASGILSHLSSCVSRATAPSYVISRAGSVNFVI
jgi:hypothetical protein